MVALAVAATRPARRRARRPGLDLLGTRLATPVAVGPTALHGLVHPEAERATAAGDRAAGAASLAKITGDLVAG